VGSPAGDRRTPEQQGHRSCRGGVRCRGEGEGERASAGERERMGGRKEGKEKKRGKGRWECRPAGHFKNEISNVWHSATLETTNVAFRTFFFFLIKI
jgi:hypothetical protein